MLFVVSVALCLYSCKPKPPGKACDNSITNWKPFITKTEAKGYIESLKIWRQNHQSLDSSNLAVAELFEGARDMMRNMMLRDSCTGIRVYYGLKQGRIIPIVCGTKANGADIYWNKPTSGSTSARSSSETSSSGEDGLMDASTPEPPMMIIGLH